MEEMPEIQNKNTESFEEQMAVREAFDSLPKELRETAILFFVQELKQKDIAKILGISLSLVKYRIRRSRELFEAYFGEEGI